MEIYSSGVLCIFLLLFKMVLYMLFLISSFSSWILPAPSSCWWSIYCCKGSWHSGIHFSLHLSNFKYINIWLQFKVCAVIYAILIHFSRSFAKFKIIVKRIIVFHTSVGARASQWTFMLLLVGFSKPWYWWII